GWHAAAALALTVGLALPIVDAPDRRWVAGGSLEPAASPVEALTIARAAGNTALLVAPSEQQLEVGRPDRHYDLARFVERFHERAGDGQFRFDPPAERVYVFVELDRPMPGPSVAAPAGTGVQPVYGIPTERRRLAHLAQQVCDEYKRAHGGARIAY